MNIISLIKNIEESLFDYFVGDPDEKNRKILIIRVIVIHDLQLWIHEHDEGYFEIGLTANPSTYYIKYKDSDRAKKELDIIGYKGIMLKRKDVKFPERVSEAILKKLDVYIPPVVFSPRCPIK